MPMRLRQSADFFQMNAGAHRRRATNFSAPALVWHRAFWIDVPGSRSNPKLLVPQLEDLRSDSRTDLKHKLDDFVLAFRQFVLNFPGSARCDIYPSVGKKIILFSRVVDADNFIRFDDLSQIDTDVLNSDNRVVTIKFDWEGIDATARIELHTEYFSITTFAELEPVRDNMVEYRTLLDYLTKFDDQSADVNAAMSERLRKFLFYEFWDERVGRMTEDKGLEKSLNEGLFNNLFADFRGLVVSNETCKLAERPDFGQRDDLSWGKQIDGSLLPLFTDIKRYECTASYMLDGRAMHMTTLGPQLPEADALELLPLQYIVYVHESDHDDADRTIVSKWQLGRLIDDLHLLGTLRLAALKYLPQLRAAGTRLSGLDGYFKEARNDLTGGISQPVLLAVHSQFAQIAMQFNETTGTDTGVLYRIERARYYIEQFNANIQGLRLRRLDGYQRYDEFVRHRLGPVFDFVDRLGVRYQRAVGALTLLDQYNVSARTQQIEEGISRGQDEIRKIQADIGRGQEEIRKIQVYGEAVLWGALVPYYLTSFADHVVVHSAMMWIALVVFSIGVGYACFRIADFRGASLPGRIAAVGSAFLAVGLIILLFYSTDTIKFHEATTAANPPETGTTNAPAGSPP